jgi:hypothetical protein
MNYINTYNHFYQKTRSIAKRMVMNEMKKAKKKNRPFLTIHNKISKEINRYCTLNYSEKLESTFRKPFMLFNDRYSFYEGGKDEVVHWVLENEVFEAFNKEHTSSYHNFIANLGIEASLKEAHRHFRNYKDYYELIYDLDKYDYFFFEDFDGMSYDSSFYYKEMLDIKDPYRIKEREELSKSQNSKNESEDNELESNKTSSTGPDYATKELLNNFTDDERYLLINVLFHLRNSEDLKLTDFMKVVKIVGGFGNNEIFYKSPKNATSYTKVAKGIDYYSGKGQVKLIESIMNKLSFFKIDFLQDELSKMTSILLREMRAK